MNTDIEIRVSYPTSSVRSDRYVSLEVTDRASGTSLIRCDIDAEQWVAILGSSSAGDIPAVLVDHDLYQRVGKTMEVEQLRWPKSDYSREVTDEMAAWGELQRTELGYETAEWRRHNYGWGIVLRRWVA